MKKLFLMRYLICHLVATVLCGACSSCRSPGYLGDRGRDAGDIMTTTIGKGAGAKVRVGPLHVGAFANRDCAGLRSGSVFSDWKRDDENFWFTRHPVELDVTVFLTEGTGPGFDQARGKTYEAGSKIPFVALVDKKPLYMHWYYYTQAEVAAGLGGTVRIGFNAGEFVDFVLGWFGMDILHDDISSENQLPHTVNLEARIARSAGYVWLLRGHYADDASRLLSAILQPSVNPQGLQFIGVAANAEITLSLDCYLDDKYEHLEKDSMGMTKRKKVVLQPGFHVYERQTNTLIQADYDVSPAQFMSFINEDMPEHSLVTLKAFIRNHAEQPTSAGDVADRTAPEK